MTLVARLLAALKTLAAAAKILWTVRKALPRPVRIMIYAGIAIEATPLPDLGVGELILATMLTVLLIRHRPLLRVCRHAARF
jgi:hypothetical protein